MMLWWNRLVAGFTALVSKRRKRTELDEELQAYLETAAEAKMRDGMSETEAWKRARAEMGSIESVKSKVSVVGWESWIESSLWDIRYGMRQLFRNPGFTAVALLTLALGIGANTAVFTLVYGIILKQLPVSYPEQLYRIGEGESYCCEWGGLQGSWGTFDYPFYKHVRDTDDSFAQLAAFSGNDPTFNTRRPESATAAQTIDGEYVSGNYFSTLGISAAQGRLISAFDDRENSEPVAVMGYRAWQNLYGADPSIVGSKLLINELPVTIVGIAPPDFFGARLAQSPPEMWIPLAQQPAFEGNGKKSLFYSSGDAWLYVIGRLQPGRSPVAVQKRLTGELQQWLRTERELGQDDLTKLAQQHIELTHGGNGVSPFRSNSKQGLLLLSSAAILVLLIACANLANLLLVRSSARRHQTALCLSLGASRGRLMRALLTESLLLSLLGGAIGVLVAFGVARGVLLIVFRGATLVPVSAAPSLPVLCFAFLLSLLTCIAGSLVPAWIGTQADPVQGLHGANRSHVGHNSRSQKVLVVIQAAVSVVLLAVAGLVSESLMHLEKANLGFQPQGRLIASISFKAAAYTPDRLPALYQRIQDRMEQMPGVVSASLSLNAPQKFCCVNLNIAIAGRNEKWISDEDTIFTRVTPHYFETIGTPIVMGRAFNSSDTQDSPHVAVVDEAFVHRFFAGQDPIGQHFGLSLEGHSSDFEIIGIAKDAKYRNPASAQNPIFFLPYSQTTSYAASGYQRLESGTLYAQLIEMRVNGNPAAYRDTVRKVLAETDPKLAPINIDTYVDQVAGQFNQERLIARLTSLFGMLALLLASIGLYGVTAYNVARRTGEIGIRMALGADRADVTGMVLKSAFLQTGLGLCLGVPLAVLCSRLLQHQLYQVSRFDPLVLGGATLVLALCAIVAAVVPARRAASVDPNSALRIE
ncbi:ABC transporter permease [Telmatobacter sp. DSM 110680]|uniref:ABC transporter permease n=1 Tax=Telmatobacter sp. DSM 110680 TaxID=3036704 RepID=A0AAU7DL91_9BACT